MLKAWQIWSTLAVEPRLSHTELGILVKNVSLAVS